MSNLFWLQYRRRLRDEYIHFQGDIEQYEFQFSDDVEALTLPEYYWLPEHLMKEGASKIPASQINAYQKWIKVFKAREESLDSQSKSEAAVGPEVFSNPPPNAEFLLHLLLRRDERDAVIGDLLEKFAKNRKRFGARRAKVWFYSEVLRSLWPLFRRIATKVTGLLALGEWIRRHVG